MRILPTLPLVCCALAATHLHADSTWFDWPYREPVDGSALDLSHLNRSPAGASGFIRVESGRFVDGAGNRVRFWGTNVSAAECFPDAESAVRLARRLAKAGINIVRIHHIDNPWAHASGGSIWKPNDPRRLDIDPGQLDILHRFMAELKANGIYVNINLKVSRTHTEADGFPASIAKAPAFQKRLDYFEPTILELQRRYARQLLGTKNPYTGLSLAEDPAMAMVEINNENALTGMRTREVGAYLDTQIPEPFKAELVRRWNAWLADKFADRDVLEKRWRADAALTGKSALPFRGEWLADFQTGNRGSVESKDATQFILRTEGGDEVRWRSGAYLPALGVENDTTYTLRFRARADQNRVLMVSLGRDEPGWRTDKWRTLGLQTIVPVTTEWKEFSFTFVSHSLVDVGSRLAMMAGNVAGSLEVSNLSLVSGADHVGLAKGEDPRAGSVPIPTSPSPRQWQDWLDFLVDLEVGYVEDLRRVVIDEIGVKVPVVNTQSNYGGIAGLVREQASEFTDTHCYWQHPDFSGATGAWDLQRYTINNSSQLSEYGPRWFGEIGGIAQLRVAGKPFTVTEVDTPFPSDYAAEAYPLLAAFAAFQDWDGLFSFDMTGMGLAPEKDDGKIMTFFDQHHHAAKWSFTPFAVHAFREGRVQPAPSRRVLHVAAPLFSEAHHLDVLWLKHQPGEDVGFLSDRLEVAPRLLPAGEASRITREPADGPRSVAIMKGADGPVLTVDSTHTPALAGYLAGATHLAGPLRTSVDAFGLNFAAVTAASLDGQPIRTSLRVLVTIAARAENTGQKWNAACTSTMSDWGHGPVRAEHVPATVSVLVDGPRRVYALAPDGSRLSEVTARVENSWLMIDTRQGPRTVHYEVVP
ncbi:MAG: carbohydrate binding domain-containing protein [Opitutaceae bacterium]|nr:carbohydrate binding domain-containing protein [Opitutaceae bacterium]